MRGPLGAAFLTLRRIGWTWPRPFVFASVAGHEYSLIEVTPRFVQDALLADWHASLEQHVARKFRALGGTKPDGTPTEDRVSAAAIVQVLRSGVQPLEPRSAGSLMAAAAGALWTNQRLHQEGYAVSPLCALCHQAPDTEHHRWWECTAVEEERSKCVDAGLRRRARNAGPDCILYLRGWLDHPASQWRPPSQGPQATTKVLQSEGTWSTHLGVDVEGMQQFAGAAPSTLFIDGSCTTQPLPECCRASWAVVRYTGDAAGESIQRPVAIVSGAVPSSWPQTPQAAEFWAAGVAAQIAAPSPDEEIRSDCAGVVSQFHDGRLDRRRKYGGVLRAARAFPGGEVMRRVVKVPAHVVVDERTSSRDRFNAHGNCAADEEAKAACRAVHPGQSGAHLDKWALQWAEALQVARVIAALGPRWPAARPPDGRRLPVPPRRLEQRQQRRSNRQQQRAQLIRTHCWQTTRGVSRCSVCGAERSQTGAATRLCAGRRPWFVELAFRSRGHQLLVADVLRPSEDPSLLVLCASCGAYAESGRSGALESDCLAVPASKHAADAIRRVRQGKFPKPGKAAAHCTVEKLQPLRAVLGEALALEPGA